MPPPPRFPAGTAVRVVPNSGRNETLFAGKVREVIWHHKHGLWNYYLEADGRRVSKRYLEADLTLIETSDE